MKRYNRRTISRDRRRTLRFMLMLPFLVPLCSMAQSGTIDLPYQTSFDSGIPAGWTTEVHDTIFWLSSDTIGTNGSGAILVNMREAFYADTIGITTPWFRPGSIDHPILRFNVALVNSNFISPFLSVWYEDGAGPAKRIARFGIAEWGDEASVTVIETSNNYVRDLIDSNLIWVPVELDLDPLTSHDSIRLRFDAEMVNGGWVLIDDVSITSGSIGGVTVPAASFLTTLHPVPNPATDRLTIDIPSEIAGGSIEVTDMFGQRLLRREIETDERKINLQTDRLSSGRLLLLLRDRNGLVVGTGQVEIVK